VGTVPGASLAEALFRWVVPADATSWRSSSPSVTSTAATAPDGRKVRFLHNWSWDPVTVRLPAPVRDVLAGTTHETGEELRLTSWDVRVLVEHRDSP
jgi:beta-galactosidase